MKDHEHPLIHESSLVIIQKDNFDRRLNIKVFTSCLSL